MEIERLSCFPPAFGAKPHGNPKLPLKFSMRDLTERPAPAYPYPFHPRKIIVEGNVLSYLDEGKGPVIVMVHGNPTWSFYYRNLVVKLRKNYRIIVPDHIGCGLSDKPRKYPYRLENHIRNLELLLEGLGIEKFSLMMHDWGGAIGMGVAVGRPQQVETLVVMNTAAFRSKRIPWRIRICRTPVLGDILVRGFNVFCRAALTMAVTRPLSPEIARGYLAPYDSWRNRIAILRFIQDIPLSAKDYSWPTLANIEQKIEKFNQAPMLLIWGGKDFCFNEHFFKQWEARFPGAERRYFHEAGHYLLEDAFDSVVPVVTGFYEKHLKTVTASI